MANHWAELWVEDTRFVIGEDFIRELLFQRECGRCFYCRNPLGSGWHLDHVWPVSRGGSNSLSNYVASCPSCNCRKRDRIIASACLIQAQLADFESSLVEGLAP